MVYSLAFAIELPLRCAAAVAAAAATAANCHCRCHCHILFHGLSCVALDNYNIALFLVFVCATSRGD